MRVLALALFVLSLGLAACGDAYGVLLVEPDEAVDVAVVPETDEGAVVLPGVRDAHGRSPLATA